MITNQDLKEEGRGLVEKPTDSRPVSSAFDLTNIKESLALAELTAQARLRGGRAVSAATSGSGSEDKGKGGVMESVNTKGSAVVSRKNSNSSAPFVPPKHLLLYLVR